MCLWWLALVVWHDSRLGFQSVFFWHLWVWYGDCSDTLWSSFVSFVVGVNFCKSKSAGVVKRSCRLPSIGLTIESRMVNWYFEHVVRSLLKCMFFLVFVLRFVPSHKPLRYKWPIEMNDWIKHVYFSTPLSSPGHIVQMQNLWLQLCKGEAMHLKKVAWLFCTCVQNRLPFLKHLSVAVTNLLVSCFLYLLYANYPRVMSLSPRRSYNEPNRRPIGVSLGFVHFTTCFPR